MRKTEPYCWTVNTKGEIWTYHPEGGGSRMTPRDKYFAFEIDLNWVGDVWIVSSKSRRGGGVIMSRPFSEPDEWHEMPAPAAATKISAGSGTVWTVNAFGEVWALQPQGGGYLASPPGEEFALDICAGLDGSVWVVSNEVSEGGNVLHSYNESTKAWTPLPAPATATNIAVGKGGELYTVNNKGEVWLRYPQGGGVQLSPPDENFAHEISVGYDGTVWVVSNEAREGGNVVMWWSGQNEIWNSLAKPAAAVKVAGAVKT